MKRFWAREDGQTLVFYALFMVVLLGMSALAIDVGFLYAGRTAVQAAADAASLAGATGIPVGTDAARSRAIQFAQANQVFGQPVVLQTPDIEFGSFDAATRAFTVSATGINAIRVTAQFTASLFFAPVLGIDTANISAQAIAVASQNVACGPSLAMTK